MLHSCTNLHQVCLIQEELGADLLADYLGPDVVSLGQAHPHLLQDELHLLILLH